MPPNDASISNSGAQPPRVPQRPAETPAAPAIPAPAVDHVFVQRGLGGATVEKRVERAA
jgi:hypothetical protein